MKTSKPRTSHNHAIIEGWVGAVGLTNDDGGSSGSGSGVGQYVNDSGGDFAVGDVVALASDGTVVLADVANDPRPIGVALDAIADGNAGPIAWSGPVDLINVTASVTAGEYAETTTTPGQAAGFASPSATSFGYFTSSGTTPSGFLARGGGIGAIIVSDTSTTVNPASELDFDPGDFVVTDAGGGLAQVSLVGGGATGVGVRAFRSGTQSITNSTFVPIDMTSEDWDDAAFHDNATNPSRLTVPSGQNGRYHVDAGSGAWDTNATGVRQLYLRTNGTFYGRGVAATANASGSALSVSDDIAMAVGDYVEAVVFQNSGGTRTVGDNTGAWLTMHKIA